MNNPPGRFAGLRARQAANDPLSIPRRPVAKVSRDGILRQIEERRQRRLLRQAGQAFPLRNEHNLGRRFVRQRHEGKRRVGRAEINTDGETVAAPSSTLTSKEVRFYSVRT